MRLAFSNKARTLSQLSGKLKSAQVAPIVIVTSNDWPTEDSSAFIGRIIEKLGPTPWIVRSSAANEDQNGLSNAGAFLSIPSIDSETVLEAIEKVFASYDTKNPRHEVLIQPMIQSVIRSGVGFSHSPDTCAPYRMVSWEDGNDTAAVTSGRARRMWMQAALSPLDPPKEISSVINLIEELLYIFDNEPLDCEFAISRENNEEVLWLLQARPLYLPKLPISQEKQHNNLKMIEEKIRRGMRPQTFLMGKRTVYGVMPDWNPAEIIGIRPKPLALSLYRELVTDTIWAYQRHNYGYRNLRSFPLMPHFMGLPYIDVRLSFNSFVPADIDHSIADRLVDHYIEQLTKAPSHHDKVEFEIVISCYTLSLDEKFDRLRKHGFANKELDVFRESLRRLTNTIVSKKTGIWRQDSAKLETLKKRRDQLFTSGADTLETIYWLIEDTKRYGSLPFAGLARAAFVAIQILRSIVDIGLLSRADCDSFLENISTVTSRLARDRATLDKSAFLSIYGHLRPGTYDILVPRYDEDPDTYFNWSEAPEPAKEAPPFSMTLSQMKSINQLLAQHGLETNAVDLFDFFQQAIELRELAKFHFTHNLSDVLSLIVKYGMELGFSREDLAFCNLSVFMELHISVSNPIELIGRSIAQGKELYRHSQTVCLPPLITEPEDVWSFEWPDSSPNFITQRRVVARVANISDVSSLKNAIVFIESADPGFDWLFSHDIGGLVTMWGGVNSHMAIRASELGLPAVIGAGEMLYRCWSKGTRLLLDCAEQRVEIMQ